LLICIQGKKPERPTISRDSKILLSLFFMSKIDFRLGSDGPVSGDLLRKVTTIFGVG
jgi:hypothetical protein